MATILQIIGFKNSGKTTLLNALIRASRKENYTVSAIKHDAHDFSIDHAGTDSYSFQENGAEAVVIANSRQHAVMEQTGIDLKTAIQKLPNTDLILVEGYKEGPFPKIILIREKAEIEHLKNSKAVHKIATHNPALKEEAIFIGEEQALNAFAEANQGVFTMKYVALQHEKIEIGLLSEKLINKNHGGINLFVGTIREWTGDIQTEEIRYTSYEEMALKELNKLATEVEAKWGADVVIVHRLGLLQITDVAVFIGVSTPHRAACYEGSRYIIERLKNGYQYGKKKKMSIKQGGVA